MRKIVTVIRPFTLNQNVFVYEDGNKIDVVTTDLESIVDTIIEISAKYEAKEIQLIGSKNFSKGIQERIETAEMTKYGKKELKIILVNS